MVSLNFPKSTYADRKWVLTSENTESMALIFEDVHIGIGASLTVGVGANFSDGTEILRIATSDVPISASEPVFVQLQQIWIWFKTDDPATRAENEAQITTGGGIELEYESIPSVPGIRLRVNSSSNSRCFYLLLARIHFFWYQFM